MVVAFGRWPDQPPGRIPSAFHFGLVSCFFSSDFPQKSLGVWEAEIGTGRFSFRRAETFLGPATSPRMTRFVPRLRGMGTRVFLLPSSTATRNYSGGYRR